MYDDQGSGELERAGAKGSSNGFSSKAREDCCNKSSKPDMIASLQLRLANETVTNTFPTVLYSKVLIFTFLFLVA